MLYCLTRDEDGRKRGQRDGSEKGFSLREYGNLDGTMN